MVKNGIVYACSRGKPFVALKPGGKGDVSESARLWTYDRGPDVPTPASDGRHIYITNDRGILFCVHARTGKEVCGGQRIASAIWLPTRWAATDTMP